MGSAAASCCLVCWGSSDSIRAYWGRRASRPLAAELCFRSAVARCFRLAADLVPVAGAEGVACPGDAWLADPVLPAVPLPPPGAACATTHVAQHRTIDSNVRFLPDFMKTSSVEFSAPPRDAGARAEGRDA